MEISIGKPSEVMPEQMAARSTPMSIRAAKVMSPLIPLKQSKWATRTFAYSLRVFAFKPYKNLDADFRSGMNMRTYTKLNREDLYFPVDPPRIVTCKIPCLSWKN